LPNLSGVPAKATSVPQLKIARTKHCKISFFNITRGIADGILSSPFPELHIRQHSNQY
jgi:hypothetical protein